MSRNKAKRAVSNVLDFKSEDGNWVKSYSVNTDSEYIQYVTRSFGLWNALNNRCKASNPLDTRNLNYIGCSNLFQSYDSFTEWCNKSYGYTLKSENGVYWNIDKDIKGDGKSYSEDNCIFVPQELNKFFSLRENHRGLYPVGVTYRENLNKFQSSCSIGGKQKFLGSFTEPSQAHSAWQKMKLVGLESYIEKYNEHKELVVVLGKIKEQLITEILDKTETKDLKIR